MRVDNYQLQAISPVDGRYRRACEKLGDYFSEAALIRYRLMTEIEYFIALCKIPLPQLAKINQSKFSELRDIYLKFDLKYAIEIKQIEETTNHDVKAVEYFLRKKFDDLKLVAYREFIHFGLTSQDVNNTAVPASLRDAFVNVMRPAKNELLNKLIQMSKDWKNVPMLAHTHGQPASPTTVGKEFYVFVERIQNQIALLDKIPFSGKFGGATGNFNAHYAAYPEIDWIKFADNFVNKTLNLTRSKTTTQIEHYDNLAAFFDNIKRINTILIDLCRDIWIYISMNYFKQRINEKEVGSSAMPHKVNPIDFENAEGNLGYANAILEHLSAKLPVSRLQRDLTDSTVIRNIGVPLAHSLIAYKSLLKGMNKLIINENKLNEDLENNWAVVSEAIQTILRREGYPEPYEALKELTRTNKEITKEQLHIFINMLKITKSVKKELMKISPHNYTGIIKF
jgi:adenylosuccinate lyase